MKVFISQPMKNKTTEQIKEERQYIVKILQELGFEILNNIFDIETKGDERIYYLGKSIELLAEADLIIFMDINSNGCRIEYEVARTYNKKYTNNINIFKEYQNKEINKEEFINLFIKSIN